MPKLPGVSAQQAVRVFEKIGFRIVRLSGHIIMRRGMERLTIPRHRKLNAYTIADIARDAGLSPEEFRRLL